MRRLLFSLVALAALALVTASTSKTPSSKPAQAAASAAGLDTATFAMGCFWCGETQFTQQPGVVSVTSGYTGGKKQHPTYEEVCTGTTGHYESVRIVYDPAKTKYETLLDMFWHGVDPTQADGQFCDRGSQYLSVVFVRNAQQRKAAEESKKALAASGVLDDPIVTQILPASTFWPAEDYHQCFWQKSPGRYRSYRAGCQRDERLAELWGDKAAKPLVH
ncbi:MAG TPA: peptide-methionine (S)-S-oxide reductase MsrA [Methylomirabilota bacterium]|nr:peptide-methionine (S)-S-oxide reductase MsrA [Methylomirabilota bacterium]